MEAILSRCGFRCDLCLAFRPNVEAQPENRDVLSDGWFSYFGFRVPPEQIICDGCWAEDGQLIDSSCPVRACVSARSLQNCAGCGDYACDLLRERLVDGSAVAARAGSPVPPEDWEKFIRPYENKRRLEQLHSDSAGRP